MQMDDIYVVPVFHHGDRFGRGPSETLEYIGEKVEIFSKMDLDFVNFGDLVTLFKGLGYALYMAVYWHDLTSSDIESGLHILRGDAGINEMRENKLRNSTTDEFYIYFDHPVDEPQIVEEDAVVETGMKEFDDHIDDNIMRELQSSPSTEDDVYDSGEDELYKPPPIVSKTVSDEDYSSCDEKNDGMKRKRNMKGKEKVLPKSKDNVKKGTGPELSGSKKRAGLRSVSGSDPKGSRPTTKPKGTGPTVKPKITRPVAKPKETGPNVKPRRTMPAVQAEEAVPQMIMCIPSCVWNSFIRHMHIA
ncbi:uncharacterized protein [Arachis hypogaea]|uniref:uncharacterized protein n=1 Tax=Arachis hypogaea TaxID=3818 RepID=UPI000DEC83D4|nr:uncharacterized protein LOC112716351 [Arachis hypogaea]